MAYILFFLTGLTICAIFSILYTITGLKNRIAIDHEKNITYHGFSSLKGVNSFLNILFGHVRMNKSRMLDSIILQCEYHYLSMILSTFQPLLQPDQPLDFNRLEHGRSRKVCSSKAIYLVPQQHSKRNDARTSMSTKPWVNWWCQHECNSQRYLRGLPQSTNLVTSRHEIQCKIASHGVYIRRLVSCFCMG
jgi:hypothetical protein